MNSRLIYSTLCSRGQLPVVKPVVQTTYKRADTGRESGGTYQCIKFFAVFIYIFLLGSPFTSRTPNNYQKINSSTFRPFKSYNLETFMTSMVIRFVHAICKRSQKWYILVHWDQFPWFKRSSCIALEYELGMKFFHWVVVELHAVKNYNFNA